MPIWVLDAPGRGLPAAADMGTRRGGHPTLPLSVAGSWARDPAAPRSLTAGPRVGWMVSGSWAQVPQRPCAPDHRAPENPPRIDPSPSIQISHDSPPRRRPSPGPPSSSAAPGVAVFASSTRAMDTAVVTVRPRFVWGRRPRANGGRRRPRGRSGFYKYPPVVSRGSYPASVKAPLPPAPVLDEFPLVPIGLRPPTGIALLDYELVRLALLYGLVARIRLLLLARTEVWTSASSYREVTNAYWRKHNLLLKTAEEARKSVFLDFGVDGPAIPERFYSRF